MAKVKRSMGRTSIEEPETFECFICLEDLQLDEASNALHCAHAACEDCLRKHWTYGVENDSVPFARCAFPSCNEYAPYRELEKLLSPRVMRRVRHLQSLYPSRTKDGRAMFCVAAGCFEQLPPAGETDDHVQVSTCPECQMRACLQCESAAHDGLPCPQALRSDHETRLYMEYAEGRLGLCPHCGVHIEHFSGCDKLQCTRCGKRFIFSPFESAQEISEGSTTSEAVENNRRLTMNQPIQLHICIFEMFYGELLMYSALYIPDILFGIVTTPWIKLLFLPIIYMGSQIYVQACTRFLLYILRELIPLFGIPKALPPWRGIRLLLVATLLSLLAHYIANVQLRDIRWICKIYLAPFVVYPLFLFCFIIFHCSMVCFLSCLGRYEHMRRNEGAREQGYWDSAV